MGMDTCYFFAFSAFVTSDSGRGGDCIPDCTYVKFQEENKDETL